MRDDNARTQEISEADDDACAEETAIDCGGDRASRIAPLLGAALSVLWWVEGEPPPR